MIWIRARTRAWKSDARKTVRLAQWIFCALAFELFIVAQEPASAADLHGKCVRAASHQGMARIPAGYYKPFFITKGIDSVRIEAFYMDVTPVTNQQFLEFVKANPVWARSTVFPILSERGYLKAWKSDFDIGDTSIDNAPVVDISWFAARAYAHWRHKRLPTIAEWEYASLAPIVKPCHATGKAKVELILGWYCMHRASGVQPVGTWNRNAYGIWDMFGKVWEWVEDFNSVLIPSSPQGGQTLVSLCGAGAAGSIDPSDYATFMRFTLRNSLKAENVMDNLGFRCVK